MGNKITFQRWFIFCLLAKLLILIAADILIFGMFIPTLFSQPDDVSVILGMAVFIFSLIGSGYCFFYVIREMIEYYKFFEKKKKDEDKN